MQQVKVGPFRYRVRRTRRMDENLYGHCDHEKQEILLRAGLVHDQAADTLLHEVLHAVFFVSHNGRPPKREEKLILRITPVLLAVLRDNPELIAYLQEQQQ